MRTSCRAQEERRNLRRTPHICYQRITVGLARFVINDDLHDAARGAVAFCREDCACGSHIRGLFPRLNRVERNVGPCRARETNESDSYGASTHCVQPLRVLSRAILVLRLEYRNNASAIEQQMAAG